MTYPLRSRWKTRNGNTSVVTDEPDKNGVFYADHGKFSLLHIATGHAPGVPERDIVGVVE